MKNKISRVVYVKKNLSIGILYNILAIFLNFISRKLFIKYIGIEFLGINGLFANVLSLLSMADMGFGVAMNYTFYKPLAENNTIRLAELISLSQFSLRTILLILQENIFTNCGSNYIYRNCYDSISTINYQY